MSLATLRNLCSGEGSEEYCTEIIGCNLLKTLKNMKDRQWADPDVEEDVNFVHDSLMANYRELRFVLCVACSGLVRIRNMRKQACNFTLSI